MKVDLMWLLFAMGGGGGGGEGSTQADMVNILN